MNLRLKPYLIGSFHHVRQHAAMNATKPNQGTNAVILYHTSSEQLRKCYDNFGVYHDVSNEDTQEVFLNYVLYNLFWMLLMDSRKWLLTKL